jgi:hypothetical protein
MHRRDLKVLGLILPLELSYFSSITFWVSGQEETGFSVYNEAINSKHVGHIWIADTD